MLDGNPIAIADPHFFTGFRQSLNISTANDGLLANDFQIEGHQLSVVSASAPANGTLTVNADGTFSYVPTHSFRGVDTFTYRVSDGANLSDPATVQIKVGDGLSANQLADDVSTGSFLHDGALALELPIGNGFSLGYRSDTIPTVLIPIDTFITPGSALPNSITADLTVDGVSSGDVEFTNQNLATGEPLRFVLRTLNAQSATGTYDWSANISLNYSNGSTVIDSFSGKTNIVNRTNSEFGSGWWLNGLDQLRIQPNGAMLENGDGSSFWFASDGTGFKNADGDASRSVLVQDSNSGYTVTDKWQNVRVFNANGKLLSISRPNNSEFDFAFEYDSSDRLLRILDQYDREFNFQWSTAGVLESVSDFANRTSAFTIANGLLTGAVVADEVENDYLAPQWQYDYTTIGGQKYLDQVTAPDGTSTEYVYRSSSRTIQEIVHPDGESWKLFATAAYGVQLGSGNTATKVADVNARYTDERNLVFEFSTDRFGNLTSLRTPLDHLAQSEFDNHGQVFRVTGADPDGAGPQDSPIVSYAYDSAGNLVTTRNADGTTTVATYEPSFNGIASFTNELGNIETWTHDATGNIATYTDANGNTWHYTHDEFGNMLTETSPAVANETPGTGDDGGGGDGPGIPGGGGLLNFTSGDEPTPIVTTYTWEDIVHNRLERITFDDGTIQEFTWTTSDQLSTHTDELGRITTYDYDPLDRITRATSPDPDGTAGPLAAPIYSWTYGDNLQVQSETDPLGNVTTYAYNDRGWLIESILPDPDGASGPLPSPSFSYAYDVSGNLIGETDPSLAAGLSVSHVYDLDGRLQSSSGPLVGQIVSFTYDALNRLTSQTDASGRVISFSYNINNELTQVIDADGSTVSWTYNNAGQVETTTDELNRTTRYDYNSTGLLKTTTLPDPDGSGFFESPVIENVYDAIGRLTKQIDAGNRDEVYIYDSRHRLVEFINKDPDKENELDGPLAPASNFYRYDDAGRLIETEDVLNRVTTYQYDELDRIVSVTLPDPDRDSGPQTNPIQQYNYDAVGNVVSTVDPRGNVTSISYDNLYRQTQITLPDPDATGPLTSPVWTLNYNTRSQIESVVDPLGQITTRVYDNAGRVQSLINTSGNATTYAYDLLNRLTKVTSPDPDGPTGSQIASETEYQYDIRSRLVATVDAHGGQTTRTYDAAGQLLMLTNAIGESTRWAYDNLGRMSMETIGESNKDYSERWYAHDTRSFDYNTTNRLVRKIDRIGRTIEYGKQGTSKTETWFDEAEDVSTWTTTNSDGDGLNGEVQTIYFDSPLEFEDADDGGGFNPGSDPGNDGNGNGGGCVDIDNDGHIDYCPLTIPPTPELGDQITTAYFRVSFNGQTTYPLPNTATAAEVRAALEELDSIADVGNVYVSKPNYNVFQIAFSGTDDVPELMTSVYLANVGDAVRTMTFDYDQAARLITASDPAASYSFEYDDLDRVTAKTENISGLSVPIQMDIAYNPMGQRTSLATSIGGMTDYLNTYEYDNLDRLITMQQTGQNGGNAVAEKRVTYRYNELGQTTYVNRYEGTTDSNPAMRTVYGYDAGNRMQMLQHRQVHGINTSTPLQTYSYSYDNLDRFKTIDSTLDGVSQFSYDALNQLTDADHAVDRPDESYGYDAIGDRHQFATSSLIIGGSGGVGANGDSGAIDAYDPNAYDQFDAEENRIRIFHDNGELGQLFTWDHRNRLTSYTGGEPDAFLSNQVHYEYDVFNRLVKRSANEWVWVPNDGNGSGGGGEPGGGGDPSGGVGGDSGGGGSDPGGVDPPGPSDVCPPGYVGGICVGDGTGNTGFGALTVSNGTWQQVVTDTYFAGFDGKTATLEFEVEEQPTAGAEDLVQRNLRRGDELVAVEAVDSNSVAGEILWALSDHLGTVRDIGASVASGQFEIVNHRVFNSFGVMTSETNPDVDLDYGFTGRFTDELSGLTHHLNRWYSPGRGRWLSEDPIGFAAGDVNLHRYVGNSVNNFVDNNGLMATGGGAGTEENSFFTIDDPKKFEAGFNYGFAHDGLLGDVKSAKNAFDQAVSVAVYVKYASIEQKQRDLNTMKVVAQMMYNSLPSLLESGAKRAVKIGKTVHGVKRGDSVAVMEAVRWQLAAMELLSSIGEDFNNMSDFQKGALAGVVAYELMKAAAISAGTSGAGAVAGVGLNAALKGNKALNLSFEVTEKIVKRFDTFASRSRINRDGMIGKRNKSNNSTAPEGTPTGLNAFGNKTKPRAPRPGKDIDVDGDGIVRPTDPPTGASTFGDVDQAPLSGHYHNLPEGTRVPDGLKITPDGSDVGGTHLPTHHTISPSKPMSFEDFVDLFDNLPWKYGGKK